MSVDAYLEAKSKFEQLDGQIKGMAANLGAVAGALQRNAGKFIFSNCEGAGLPMEASMSRDSVSFDATKWPSPARIQATLGEWHSAKSAMLAAWTNVPRDKQANLIGPPNMR